MGRLILAVIIGYIVLALLVMAITPVVSKILLGTATPSEPTSLTGLYLSTNLASGFLAALAGGYVAALVGRGQTAARILSGLVLLAGIVFGLLAKTGPQPQWYLLVLPILGGAGVFLGGWLRGGP